MTITAAEAYEAVLEHHSRLGEELAGHAGAVSAAAAAGRPHGAAVAGLLACLAGEVLPHAAAEEKTVYPAAARAGLAAAVAEMTAEHVTLSDLAARIAAAPGGQEAAGLARQAAALFTAHAARENEELLPALLAGKSADLAALLAQAHEGTGHQEAPAPAGGRPQDAQDALVSLLLAAAAALARAGQADRGCTIAASAWAALHGPRPDLAARVTAALHGLARRAGGDPAQAPAPAAGEDPGQDPVLDVRDLAPARRHEVIFTAYRHLAPGAAFVLVNDHDPKPLRYQFAAEHPGRFTWDYLQAGPGTWRVRIGRPAAGGPAGTGAPGSGAREPDLDVRQVSHAQRHGLIFTAYRHLAPGAAFVLVNDHDPKPLRYQFQAQHPGQYTWDYLETGPETWRVRIGRAGA